MGMHFDFERSEKSCISFPPQQLCHPEANSEGPCIFKYEVRTTKYEKHAVKRETSPYL